MTKQEINKYTKYSAKLSQEEMNEIYMALACVAFICLMVGGFVGLMLTQGTY